MKKILFVLHSLEFGGAERSLVNLLQQLPEDKYNVDLLLFQKKGGFLSQLPEWVRVLNTPLPLRKLYAPVREAGRYCLIKVGGTICSHLFRRTKKARKAFRWRHFYRYAIVSLPDHYDVAIAYVGAEIMYFVNDRVSADRKMVWIHNDYRAAGYSRTDDMPYFQKMDAIVSVSEACVGVLKEEFPELQSRIHYLQNISSSNVVRKLSKMFEPVEYKNIPCRILSVGRLWPQKGFAMAIDAAAIMKEKGLEFRWFVIGEGYLREELERRIAERSVADCFVLLGTRSNPYPYIGVCSVLVQPSVYEGKSVVLDEAKILRRPIIATAYPTVRDQIQDRKEGLIVGMTPQAIAEGILEMLKNQMLREEIQEYLSTHEYGNQAEVEKYMELLD